LMSMVAAKIPGARVLDPMAGSGAMALEALSRGAEMAVLADSSPNARRVIAANIALLQAPAKLVKATQPQDIGRLLAYGPFDLVFLDPPYQKSLLALEFSLLAVQRKLVTPGAWLVWEQSPQSLLELTDLAVRPWIIKSSRTWGQRAAAILTLPEAEPTPQKTSDSPRELHK
jgi:16S rRNA (guanine966-N2)-methyltransferase